ncbi:MAG: sigma-E processing peptidase SpoIIGA [Oscillospiraceae bacterium]|nr:sigma-E processing peptidase SpoIIGA [Oscillospiraceae bacterium]
MRVIYADVVFVVNLAVDYLLLTAAAGFSGLPFKRRRLLLAAVFGALYSVAACLPGLQFLGAAGAVAAGLICILIAFGFDTRQQFIKRCVIFFAVSCLFAGAVTAALTTFEATFIGGVSIPMWARVPLLILSAMLGCGLLSAFFSGGGTHAMKNDIVKITVEMNNKTVSFSALVDTGNTLRDPITNSRVMICETAAVKSLFSYQCRTLLEPEDYRSPSRAIEKLSDAGAADRFRIVPYRTVAGEGMMLAFAPERIWADGKEIRGTMIAVSPNAVSEGAGYCALHSV